MSGLTAWLAARIAELRTAQIPPPVLEPPLTASTVAGPRPAPSVAWRTMAAAGSDAPATVTPTQSVIDWAARLSPPGPIQSRTTRHRLSPPGLGPAKVSIAADTGSRIL